MKSITRYFTTLKQAEQYQDRLYDQYDNVLLVSWPRFCEAGTYAWRVK